MKKILSIITFAVALIAIVAVADSCKKLLSKNIELNGKEFQFEIKGGASKADADQVLYEGNIEVNVAEELEKQGLSEKNLKSLLMKQGKVVLVKPAGFDMNIFNGMKLYFGTKDYLVATCNEVKGNVVYFTISNPELLNQLKNDNLHIIVTGTKPVSDVTVKLVADYVANIGLL